MAEHSSRARIFRWNVLPRGGGRERRLGNRSLSTRPLRVEVLEDRLLLAADFGDAPHPYPTVLASNGARHEIGGPRLGALVDADLDGHISATASGDDTADLDDEDGVTFNAIQVGQLDARVLVNVQNAPLGAKLDAWIDFNGDGIWDTGTERIAASAPVTQGDNLITFDVPATIASGTKYARFRLSTADGLSPSGAAADGEVEDLSVSIDPPAPSRSLFGHERVIVSSYNDVSTVAAGDIDSDGDADLVSASSSYGGTNLEIRVSKNDGAGNFVTHTVATGLERTWRIRLADVDQDGDLDIISAGQGTSALAWHENQGAGVFATHKVTTTIATNYDVWASDVDGDGDVDLLSTGGGFAWYENDGAQNFAMRSVDGSGLSAVRAADIDRDGDTDIVVSQYNQSALLWYENNGAESFTRRTIVSTSGLSIEDVAIGDIDRDGHIDIVAGFTTDTSSRIRWYRNNGAGVFQEKSISTTSNRVSSVDLFDLDGDADLDIVTANDWSSAGTIFSYKNDGLGTFSQKVVFVTGFSSQEVNSGAKQVIPTDMDGDGDIDLAAAFSDDASGVISGDRLSWFENTDHLVSLATSGPSSPQEFINPVFTFAFTRSGNISIPLTIEFAVEGTATFGSDYVQSGATSFDEHHGSIVIPAGGSGAVITVSTLDDALYELNETLRLRPLELAPYALDSEANSPWTWTIIDNDPADFGDAPAPYSTTIAQKGPRHGGIGPTLGTTRDVESDGQPNAAATGDDETADSTGGISFGAVQAGQQNATVTVNVQSAPFGARLDAWLDFDRDGNWNGPADHILTSVLVHEGINTLEFEVPTDAQSGQTFGASGSARPAAPA